MFKWILPLLCFLTSLHCNVMQEFVASHLPMREDGKIAIPKEFKHVKIDIGLSYSAPMSQQWLSKEKDLIVFGFEPDLNSVHSIKTGAQKRDPSHGDPIELRHVGQRFFLLPCALGLLSGESAKFYLTKHDSGCSSLYPPKQFEVEEVVEVPVFCLSDFFDLFPFDTHPLIEYIKIDAQGSDLDIVKSAGSYLEKRVVYITIEAENEQYLHTNNSEAEIDQFMKEKGFQRVYSAYTRDPTYLNLQFTEYVRRHPVKIFQRG